MESIPTCLEQVKGTTHIGSSMAHKSSIEGVLTTTKSLKGNSGYQTLVGEHKAPKESGNNTLNRDHDVYSTSEGDQLSVHEPQEDAHVFESQ